MAAASTGATRRAKWQPLPAPPPSPKILNLPRRVRRKQPKKAAKKQAPASSAIIPATRDHHRTNPFELHQKYYCRGKLESLFGHESQFSKTVPIVLLNSSLEYDPRRERVDDYEEVEFDDAVKEGGEERSSSAVGSAEEKWKFQAEMLRAECNFLRMEREFALKKLEKNRLKMQKTLRSAVQSLVSGRKKIGEGKNVSTVLEEEIEDLAEKLEDLQRSSKLRDYEVKNCSNFDKQASILQRRLEKLGGLSDESYAKKLQELADSNFSLSTCREIDKESYACKREPNDVELLQGKVEGLSKGMLERMEEQYGAMLSSTANSSVASSASTSKRIECPEPSSFSSRQNYQELKSLNEENKCSGRCKSIVRRILEQVKAETEQWSQMQEMLGQVRGEMEDLQTSRDFWEKRASDSASETQSLQSEVQQWKDKALTFENRANELQTELTCLKQELEKIKTELIKGNGKDVKSSEDDKILLSLGKQIQKEKQVKSFRLSKQNCQPDKGSKHDETSEQLDGDQQDMKARKDLPPISLGKQLEKEKLLLLRRLKDNRHSNDKDSKVNPCVEGNRKANINSNAVAAPKRSPFKDIGNLSPLVKQKSRAIFPLRSPRSCKAEQSA